MDSFEESEQQPEKPLSHSQIGSYLRCPMTTFFRYEKGMKAPPVSAISFGVSIHKALEHNFSQKRYSRRDVPVSVVQDVFRDAWKEAVRETVFDPEKDETPDEFLDHGVAMLGKYQREIAPTIMPKEVETKFTLRLPGVKRDIIGYIDLIDENEVIVDHKTSKMQPKADMLAKAPQLTLYKMGYRARHGHDPRGLRLDYLIRKINRRSNSFQPEIIQAPVFRTVAQEQQVAHTIKTVSEAMSLKKYYPNTDHFGCTPAGCGYWSQCQGKVLAGETPEWIEEIKEMQKAAYKKIIEEGA
jgi:RecB family exonuclease